MTTTTKRPDGELNHEAIELARKAAFALRPAEQYRLAAFVAENVGYVLGREPDHPESPHTPTNESPAPQADATANDIADALERSTQSMARECKVGMGLWNGHSNACLNAVALLRKASVSPAPQPPVEGLRELFRELIAYRENYRPTWATALPNLSWEQFDIILAALASPSLTAARETRTGAHLLQTAKSMGWLDDGEGALEFMLRRCREVAFEDCGRNPAPTTLIEQSGQKRRER